MKLLLRNISYAITLILILAACNRPANNTTPDELILGKWRFASFDIPEHLMQQGSNMDHYQFTMMEQSLKMMVYTFFKDGTYAMDGDLNGRSTTNMERGTFKFINDGKVLNLESTSGEKKRSGIQEWEIDRLTSDSLIMGSNGKPARMIMLKDATE